jgi:hypothetical protein
VLSSSKILEHCRHFDYWNQPLNMRMRVSYVDCHEAGLCCYLVIHIANLLRPLQLFYFHLWPIYWFSILWDRHVSKCCIRGSCSSPTTSKKSVACTQGGLFPLTCVCLVFSRWVVCSDSHMDVDVCHCTQKWGVFKVCECGWVPFLPEFLQLCFHGIFVVFAKPKHNRNGRDDLPVCFVLFVSACLPHNVSSAFWVFCKQFIRRRTSICKRMSDLR